MTTLTMDPTATTEADEAAYARMVEYIAEATTVWWAYLAGLTPEFCRERFTTEFARGLAHDVYAHEVEQGASDADAVAAAGAVVVRNTIAAVSDERVTEFSAALRDHVRQSVTQG